MPALFSSIGYAITAAAGTQTAAYAFGVLLVEGASTIASAAMLAGPLSLASRQTRRRHHP